MQSFRIDFEMNQGHEMTIDRESGICRSELDEIELRMLHSGKIAYLLPVDWFELDGKVTFRYKLSGMKMLLHRLQQQPLTMEQYYTLILGVTDALFECKHYMLRPEGCLLDEQFIFTSERLHDIHLAYVPMKGGTDEQMIGAGDLLSLVVRFTSYIDKIDGKGLKRVLHHLTGKRWPLAELRATLLDLIGESTSKQQNGIEQTMHHRVQPSLPIEQAFRPVQQQAEEQGDQAIQPPPQLLFSNKELENKRHPAFFEIDIAPRTFSLEEAEPVTKKKWMLTAGLVIAIACVWRFLHFAAATKQSLLISLGITLLLLVAILFVWRKRVNPDASSAEAESEPDQYEPFEPYEPDSGMFPGLANIYAEHEISEAASKRLSDELYEGNTAHSAAVLHAAAANTLSPIAEPTVLLGRDQNEQHPGDPAIWLQRSWEGQHDKLELIEGCFKIGRMGEQINYADFAGGISRLHLEIESLKGEYRAKDLGSRNGSLLNGQTMIPYKSYKLSIGDVIQLAGAKGPSYELKSG